MARLPTSGRAENLNAPKAQKPKRPNGQCNLRRNTAEPLQHALGAIGAFQMYPVPLSQPQRIFNACSFRLYLPRQVAGARHQPLLSPVFDSRPCLPMAGQEARRSLVTHKAPSPQFTGPASTPTSSSPCKAVPSAFSTSKQRRMARVLSHGVYACGNHTIRGHWRFGYWACPRRSRG